jgi:hypothetical protein
MFKYFKKSFVRYFAMGLALSLVTFLINSCDVNAADATLVNPSQSKWDVASQAACYNSSGTSLTTSYITSTATTNGILFNPYFQCNSFTSGGYLVFNMNEKTSVNQLYSLTVYVGNSVTSIYPSNSYTYLGLGNYAGQALSSVRTGSPTAPTIYSYSDSYNINTEFYQPTTSALNTASTKVLYVIFKANTEFPFIAIQLNYTGSPGNIFFFGYKLTSLGDATNLTSSQVKSIVDSSTSNLATASDVSSINSSISTSEANIKSQIEESTNQIDNTLNDSDTSSASSDAGDFFNGFETDTFGLTSIITAPLDLIASITSSTCSPLALNVPFVENSTLNLPCMSTVYSKYFGSFFTIYQTITFGFIAYWVCVRIFAMVKDFKNPDHDEIEVMDL